MPGPQKTKQSFLRQQGTLNPRPEAVQHENFRDSEFFDPQDLVQVKYEMLRQVEVDKQPVSQAAKTFGFSRPSFYQAQATFQEIGLAGLLPHKRGPRSGHKLTNELMQFVAQLRVAEPGISSPQLAERIARHFGTSVHPRSILRDAWLPHSDGALLLRRHPSGAFDPDRWIAVLRMNDCREPRRMPIESTQAGPRYRRRSVQVLLALRNDLIRTNPISLAYDTIKEFQEHGGSQANRSISCVYLRPSEDRLVGEHHATQVDSSQRSRRETQHANRKRQSRLSMNGILLIRVSYPSGLQ